MAHESFEDQQTAAEMNAGFVCVKVDREERPDVDAVYMAATQAMTGQGGWPMTVFAAPAGQPFYCGTYFPDRPRGGMPSFRQLLAAVSATWRERRAEVEAVGAQVGDQLREFAAPVSGGAPDVESLTAAVSTLAERFDATHGGFGGAPKFPPAMTLLQLTRHHARTGSAPALDMVERTCAAMARGGIHDQLAGGFARYAVDRTWTVPHFEKMLYDNALLLRVYAGLCQLTKSGFAARIAGLTGDFLLRDLRTAEGAFASSLDADTSGVEGLTYVWTLGDLAAALDVEDATWAARLFGVTETGDLESGASVLRLSADPDPRDDERYSRVRAQLLSVRAGRPQPRRDDKVVAAWNGLAITALAEASLALDRPDLLAAATECARLLVSVHLRDGRLARTSRDGVASANPGVLEDYGCVAEAFCVLYSATGELRWLDHARALLETVRAQFMAEAGFYDTAADADGLFVRPSDPTDNATPSGASAAAAGFAAFALAAGSLDHLDDAYRALAAAGRLAAEQPLAVGYGLAVAEALHARAPAAFMCPGPFCA